MLALDLRRQHLRISDQHPSPALSHPHRSYFDQLPYTQSTPSPSTFNSTHFTKSTGYFDPSPVLDSSALAQSLNGDQYMTDAYNLSNPAIRIQQSSPAPGQHLPQSFDSSPAYNNWTGYNQNSQLMASRPLHAAALQRNRQHQRAQSSSSMGSTGSASPFSQHGAHAPYAYSAADSTPSKQLAPGFTTSQDHSSTGFSNSLPTPNQTPTQDSFLTANYPTSSYSQGGDMRNVTAAHLAMNNNLDSLAVGDDEIPDMSHSGRQSVSSLGHDPSTPRTIPESNFDDSTFKVPSTNGESSLSTSIDVDAWLDEYLRYDDDADQQRLPIFPKLDRTVSDAYNDVLYNAPAPAPTSSTSAPKQNMNQHLSPHRNMINEYLQAAQMARSQSPTSQGSRGVSPFRPSSPYVSNTFGQVPRPYTVASVRQAQQAHASQVELSQHVSQPQDDEPKTISPKDAVLEYNETEEDAKMPLFSENEASQFGSQYVGGGGQQNFSAVAQNVNGLSNASRAGAWTNDAPVRSINPPMQPQSSASFNFATPAYPHGLPFSSQNYRPQASMKQEETPEFPAHLTSMESSASEAPPSSMESNQSSHVSSTATTKPANSAADSGTYTCTFHGCNQRFETPQKLQKHKRDNHRNPAVGTTPTPGIGSGMSSAQLAARNSQTGPHKCDRINPTTGKPCNTIFSRPYDLTRHEDTIHNARKQKVRCALCVEDKTFSRNDALTRHMRVVHPEVDFPGKHRRRGD